MSSKSGFFCELPTATIKKIRRLAHAAGSQGAAVQAAIERMPEPPAVTAKTNGQEMLARALVKDAKRGFKGPGLTGNELALTFDPNDAGDVRRNKGGRGFSTPLSRAKRRPFVPPTRVQLNVLRANKVTVTPGSMSRSAAAKMITEIMIMKRSKREGRAARRRVRG